MNDLKAGWDCYGDCGRSIADGITLHRTRPKGQPGDFMCADCAGSLVEDRAMHEWDRS